MLYICTVNDLFKIDDNEKMPDDGGKAKALLLELRANYLKEAQKFRSIAKDYEKLADEYEKKAETYDKALYVLEDKVLINDFPKNENKKGQISEKDIKKIKWRKESINAITKSKRLMLTAEILDFIMEFKLSESDRKKYIGILSGSLGKLSKAPLNKLKIYDKKGVKGNYYGLSEWFNENEPKEEYRP